MADQGFLSQAIANMQSLNDHLGTLAQLPPGADQAKASVQGSVAGAIPVIRSSSQTVLAFVDAGKPLADEAMAALAAGDASAVKARLGELQTASQPAKGAVASATRVIQATIGNVNAQLAVLGQIDGTLQSQINQAQNELNLAQSSADDLEKKKYYWLLAGPFGLIGLGICIGMIVDATQRVTGLQQRASELRGQMAQWSKMKADVDLAIAELPAVGAKLQTIQNGIDFIGGDIGEVLNDVAKAGGGSIIARAYIMTAQHELDALRHEAA